MQTSVEAKCTAASALFVW